jgi:hypothetical protein
MRLGFGRKVDKRTGEKENYVTGYKQYSKECTIRINYISTESIRAISVVKAVEEITGLNSVLAVVRDSNSYRPKPRRIFPPTGIFLKMSSKCSPIFNSRAHLLSPLHQTTRSSV